MIPDLIGKPVMYREHAFYLHELIGTKMLVRTILITARKFLTVIRLMQMEMVLVSCSGVRCAVC